MRQVIQRAGGRGDHYLVADGRIVLLKRVSGDAPAGGRRLRITLVQPATKPTKTLSSADVRPATTAPPPVRRLLSPNIIMVPAATPRRNRVPNPVRPFEAFEQVVAIGYVGLCLSF